MSRDRRKHHAKESPLTRNVGIRPARRTFVVFCEGERTEPDYLQALRRLPEVRDVAAIDLRVESLPSGYTPLSLVRIAVGAMERAAEEESEIDEFWCVFDVEWPHHHPHLRQAITLASERGIRLAVSNPCFELWLILHFRDWHAFLDNVEAQRARRTCDKRAGKRVDGEIYLPKRAAAARRAAALAKRHTGDGTVFPHDNPSSGMYLLLDALDPSRRAAG